MVIFFLLPRQTPFTSVWIMLLSIRGTTVSRRSVMNRQHIRLLRLPEVMQMTGLSRTTIYRLMRIHLFPDRVLIGARAVAWRETDILGWMEDRPLASSR